MRLKTSGWFGTGFRGTELRGDHLPPHLTRALDDGTFRTQPPGVLFATGTALLTAVAAHRGRAPNRRTAAYPTSVPSGDSYLASLSFHYGQPLDRLRAARRSHHARAEEGDFTFYPHLGPDVDCTRHISG